MLERESTNDVYSYQFKVLTTQGIVYDLKEKFPIVIDDVKYLLAIRNCNIDNEDKIVYDRPITNVDTSVIKVISVASDTFYRSKKNRFSCGVQLYSLIIYAEIL